MAEYTDRESAVYPGASIKEESHETDAGKGWYSQANGRVATPHGFVMVHSSQYIRPNGTKRADSYLEFIHKGRSYVRFFHGRAYSGRYLVTLAKRFAAEKTTT